MKYTKEHIDLFKRTIAVICSEFDLAIEAISEQDDSEGYLEIVPYEKHLIDELMEAEHLRISAKNEIENQDKEEGRSGL